MPPVAVGIRKTSCHGEGSSDNHQEREGTIIVNCNFRKGIVLKSQLFVNPPMQEANLVNWKMPITGNEKDRKTQEEVNCSDCTEARNSSDKDECKNSNLSPGTNPESTEQDKHCSSTSTDSSSEMIDTIAALAAASATKSVAPPGQTFEACHSSIVPTTEAGDNLVEESSPTGIKAAAVEDLPTAEDAVHSLNCISTNEVALIDPTAPPWTAEQHREFVAAIFEVGLKNCSPSVIMENMRKQPKYITRERTKSHLQKYRQTRLKNKDDFLIQYDTFLAVSQKIKEDTIKSTGKEPIPRAVLEAALGGRKTSKLVGGEAAAVLTFSVLNNCSPDHGPDQIPYRAVRTFFPALTNQEKESSLGASLLFVKGMLHNMTDVLLKARHGISKPLDDGNTEDDSSSSPEEEESSDDEAEDGTKPEVDSLSANNLQRKPSSATITSNASADRERMKAPNGRFGPPIPSAYPEPQHRGPPAPSYGPYPPPHYFGPPPIPNHIHPNHGPFYHQPNHLNHMPYGPPTGAIMNPHAHVPPHFGAPPYHGPPLASSFPLGPGSYPTYQSYNNDEYYPYAPASHQSSYQEEEYSMNNSNGRSTPLSRANDSANSDPRYEPFPLDLPKDKRKLPDNTRNSQSSRPPTVTSSLIPDQRKRRSHSLRADEVEHHESTFSIHSTAIKSKASPIQSRKKRAAHTSWHHSEQDSPTTSKPTKEMKRDLSPVYHSASKQKVHPLQHHSMETPPRGQSPGKGSDNKKLSPDFFFDGSTRFSPSELSITTSTSHDGQDHTAMWEPLAIDVHERSLENDNGRGRMSTGGKKRMSENYPRNQTRKEHSPHESKEYSDTPDSHDLRSQFFFGD